LAPDGAPFKSAVYYRTVPLAAFHLLACPAATPRCVQRCICLGWLGRVYDRYDQFAVFFERGRHLDAPLNERTILPRGATRRWRTCLIAVDLPENIKPALCLRHPSATVNIRVPYHLARFLLPLTPLSRRRWARCGTCWWKDHTAVSTWRRLIVYRLRTTACAFLVFCNACINLAILRCAQQRHHTRTCRLRAFAVLPPDNVLGTFLVRWLAYYGRLYAVLLPPFCAVASSAARAISSR